MKPHKSANEMESKTLWSNPRISRMLLKASNNIPNMAVLDTAFFLPHLKSNKNCALNPSACIVVMILSGIENSIPDMILNYGKRSKKCLFTVKSGICTYRYMWKVLG